MKIHTLLVRTLICCQEIKRTSFDRKADKLHEASRPSRLDCPSASHISPSPILSALPDVIRVAGHREGSVESIPLGSPSNWRMALDKPQGRINKAENSWYQLRGL